METTLPSHLIWLPSRCRSSRWPTRRPSRRPDPSLTRQCGQCQRKFSGLYACGTQAIPGSRRRPLTNEQHNLKWFQFWKRLESLVEWRTSGELPWGAGETKGREKRNLLPKLNDGRGGVLMVIDGAVSPLKCHAGILNEEQTKRTFIPAKKSKLSQRFPSYTRTREAMPPLRGNSEVEREHSVPQLKASSNMNERNDEGNHWKTSKLWHSIMVPKKKTKKKKESLNLEAVGTC